MGIKAAVGDVLALLSSFFLKRVVMPVVDILMEFVAITLYQVFKSHEKGLQARKTN